MEIISRFHDNLSFILNCKSLKQRSAANTNISYMQVQFVA